jgi:hypothetical protein
MSLYNMLFETDGGLEKFLLTVLGRERGDFGRYRAIYVTEEYIIVHTRNGGGNREEYGDYLEDEDHPLYSHNEDCDYDDTYADVFYRHPEELKPLLRELATAMTTPAENWRALLEGLSRK